MDPDFGQTNYSNNSFNNTEPSQPINYSEKSDELRNLQAKQDEQIDMIAASVGIQKKIAQNIDQEINEQEPLLDEISSKVNNVDAHIQKTTQKVEKVRLRASDKVSILIVGVLLVALVIVIILAIVL
ncbi:syntaxin, putative [Entamoeba dispar SAW760]|uniref:Syntaxin, putative n=1 Tax=Entamoeba dispar (strain ATCC PRA-260 / SAW760) TaxID=370354 RepID=B0E9X9_ENTDS|nr:syntaxin, putative [Entamoeba dispar SAW760]XP_001736629.1 syntaxin, putative [Entamoeba dispar SAW760]EDR27112.1 syntaxin, putative [Entamoeba dispar SAW760]EDR28664.1 syntaxin, putative [Entamoeba dispar SAW760]|eukprot:EDR27112.1 syntaxin, putative [Entamoeba dispar SAW760]